MKAVVITLVILFVLALVGVGVFAAIVLTNGPVNLPGMPVTVATTPEDVAKLMEGGKPVKCTVQTDDEKMGSHTMVMYMDGERSREDITSVEPGVQEYDSHFIADGEYQYVWTEQDGTMTGTKFKLTEEMLSDINASIRESVGDLNNINAEDQAKFKAMTRCERWSVDEALFVPPSDIEFKAMNSIEDSSMIDPENVNLDDVCGMCEQAGDADSIAQCKEALSC